MRKIYLLRHAQAEEGLQTSDSNRPLTEHGQKQALQIGHILKDRLKGRPINHVLCSSAIRTQQTLDALKENNSFDKINITDRLYNAPASNLKEEIDRTDSGDVLVIAHNPGIHQLAFELAKSSDAKTLDQLTTGYSPATLSVFEGEKLIELIIPD